MQDVSLVEVKQWYQENDRARQVSGGKRKSTVEESNSQTIFYVLYQRQASFVNYIYYRLGEFYINTVSYHNLINLSTVPGRDTRCQGNLEVGIKHDKNRYTARIS